MSRILIAEDDPRIARFVVKGLRAHGLAPTVVSDGTSALAHAHSGDYDLMLLDIGLPQMDGFTVLRSLRETDDQLPVIIITARDSDQDRATGLNVGADDYLTKPFGFHELLARIRHHLPGPGQPGRPLEQCSADQDPQHPSS